jgi:hypothetical protein
MVRGPAIEVAHLVASDPGVGLPRELRLAGVGEDEVDVVLDARHRVVARRRLAAEEVDRAWLVRKVTVSAEVSPW